MGSTSSLTVQAINAILTFAIYPITLFDGSAKFLLFTILPAAFVGAVPAELVRAFSWSRLVQLLAAALILLALALLAFYRGLPPLRKRQRDSEPNLVGPQSSIVTV